MLLKNKDLLKIVELAVRIFRDPIDLQEFMAILHMNMHRYQQGIDSVMQVREELLAWGNEIKKLSGDPKADYDSIVVLVTKIHSA